MVPLKGWKGKEVLGLRILENHMGKKMENCMETAVIKGQ